MRKELLIVIPTYQERENIIVLLQKIIEIVPKADILVVDDSSDGTALAIKRFSAQQRAGINVLERSRKEGLGSAYKTGFRYGLQKGYRVIITMDADLSHNPRHLPDILSAIQNHDMVIGSRYIRGGGTVNWGMHRIFLSWFANRFARFILGLKGSDLTSGYRAYRTSILRRINFESVRSNGYSFLVEILFYAVQNLASIQEVPIVFLERREGKSKISGMEIYRGVFTLFRLKWGKIKKCLG